MSFSVCDIICERSITLNVSFELYIHVCVGEREPSIRFHKHAALAFRSLGS